MSRNPSRRGSWRRGPRILNCPLCGTQSVSRHSRYWRKVQDLPIQGTPVILHLRLSRWRCRNRDCSRKIFAERLAKLIMPLARRTNRVTEMVLLMGYCIGGRRAEVLLKHLAMSVSDDTILRGVKRLAKPGRSGGQHVRILGVDDWAWKKGQNFGTILIDLEKSAVVDLLARR